jgi:hypothetical protein
LVKPSTVKPSTGERYSSPAARNCLILARPASVGVISGGRTKPEVIRPRCSRTHLPGAGLVSTKSRSTRGCSP